MDRSNQTSPWWGPFSWASQPTQSWRKLFVLILLTYLVILLGNGLLILVTTLDSRLHTPIYFFLGNLSFLDICYTTSSVPLILDSFLTPRKTISFSTCACRCSFPSPWQEQSLCS